MNVEQDGDLGVFLRFNKDDRKTARVPHDDPWRLWLSVEDAYELARELNAWAARRERQGRDEGNGEDKLVQVAPICRCCGKAIKHEPICECCASAAYGG